MHHLAVIVAAFSSGPVVSDPDPQLTATTGDVNADVAGKREGSESAAMAKAQTVPKKPLSSHRPDDEVPGAAAILENLEVGDEFVRPILFPLPPCDSSSSLPSSSLRWVGGERNKGPLC